MTNFDRNTSIFDGLFSQELITPKNGKYTFKINNDAFEYAMEYFGVSNIDDLTISDTFNHTLNSHIAMTLSHDIHHDNMHSPISDDSYVIDFNRMKIDKHVKMEKTKILNVYIIDGILMTPEILIIIKRELGPLPEISNMPPEAFIHMVKMGNIKGIDLISLCASNPEISIQCDNSGVFPELLLTEFGIENDPTPREAYFDIYSSNNYTDVNYMIGEYTIRTIDVLGTTDSMFDVQEVTYSRRKPVTFVGQTIEYETPNDYVRELLEDRQEFAVTDKWSTPEMPLISIPTLLIRLRLKNTYIYILLEILLVWIDLVL